MSAEIWRRNRCAIPPQININMKYRLRSLALLAVGCVAGLSSCVAPLPPVLPCAPVLAPASCRTVTVARPLVVGGWNNGCVGGFGGGFYSGGCGPRYVGGGGPGFGGFGRGCGPRYSGGCGPSFGGGCW
jgi:hypothetical protein